MSKWVFLPFDKWQENTCLGESCLNIENAKKAVKDIHTFGPVVFKCKWQAEYLFNKSIFCWIATKPCEMSGPPYVNCSDTDIVECECVYCSYDYECFDCLFQNQNPVVTWYVVLTGHICSLALSKRCNTWKKNPLTIISENWYNLTDKILQLIEKLNNGR